MVSLSAMPAGRRRAALVLAAGVLLLAAATPAGAQPPWSEPTVTAVNAGEISVFVDAARNALLASSNQAVIRAWGVDFLQAIALILIVWTGLRVAFSGTFQAWELIRFVMTLCLPYAMLEFYARPFPLPGMPAMTFPGIVTGLSDAIVGLFGADILAEGIATVIALARDHLKILEDTIGSLNPLTAVVSGFKHLTQFSLMAMVLGTFIAGMIVVLALAAAQVIFAELAIAVLVTLGPVFIPFMIVPKLDFLFWGWLKALIQFSLYAAIAAIMVGLWTNIILGYARGLIAENFTTQAIASGTGLWLVPVGIVLICAFVSVLKIGDIAGMIVGGGSDGGGFIGGAFMAGRIVASPARVAGGAATAPLKGGIPG